MERRLLLASLFAAAFSGNAFAQTCDTTFTLVNRSGETVHEFYYNPASNQNWGPDRLGDGVLVHGRQRLYRPSRGGLYDFKVVWESGDMAEVRGINICETSNVIVKKNGISAE